MKENPNIWSWFPIIPVSRQHFLLVILGASVTVILLTKKDVHHYKHIPSPKFEDQCCRNVRANPGFVESLCSEQATNRGTNQKVLSYSIYGDFDDEYMHTHYYNEFERRIQESFRLYPGE